MLLDPRPLSDVPLGPARCLLFSLGFPIYSAFPPPQPHPPRPHPLTPPSPPKPILIGPPKSYSLSAEINSNQDSVIIFSPFDGGLPQNQLPFLLCFFGWSLFHSPGAKRSHLLGSDFCLVYRTRRSGPKVQTFLWSMGRRIFRQGSLKDVTILPFHLKHVAFSFHQNKAGVSTFYKLPCSGVECIRIPG